jgi:pimeloyl-ACP methyl ester carboxylesterase
MVPRRSLECRRQLGGRAMERAKVNGVELEYEVKGSGEPVLLIDPVVPGAVVSFLSAPALVDRYRLIRYHKRGWVGSTHTAPPVRIADHAADAAALLDHLGVSRAHVAGHSSGGSVAMQLAFERPDLVHTLALLEPTLFGVPSAPSLFERAAPSMEAYGAGDHEGAVIGFLSLVSGLDRDTCRHVIDGNVPDGIARTISDADTFFGVELPALGAWAFGPDEAAVITQPVLSLLGRDTEQLWVEVAALLRSWFPRVEELAVDGVGHLLQMQRPQPVARGVAAFLGRYPMVPAENGKSHARARAVVGAPLSGALDA